MLRSYYYLLTFLAGACIMTLELVAGRIIAPHLGVSLYTWTSVIGVVLAGISAGSFAGGWLADRFSPVRLLAAALILAGLCTAAVLPALSAVMEIRWPPGWPPLLKVFLPMALLFGIPSLILGVIAPVVYRILITDLGTTGRTAGRLAASHALGSIGGTFATGFYLIPAVGTRTIVYAVAVTLAVLGVTVLPGRPRVKTGFIVVFIATAVFLGSGPLLATLRPAGVVESAYYTIRILKQADPTGGIIKVLMLDRLLHSAANPERPDSLWYEQERIAAWLMSRSLGNRPNALFLGGGGYTLPCWMERHFPGAAVEVAEIDPAVTEAAFKHFIDNPLTRIVTHNLDARMVVKNLPSAKRYDFIYGDVFNDLSVPYQLTTREFFLALKNHLADNGLFVVNLVDKPDGPFLKAFAHTAAQVFPHVKILPGSGKALEGRYGPNLVVAGHRALPWDTWLLTARFSFPVSVRDPDPNPFVLTDDYAPVENLLLPAYAELGRP